VLFSTRREVAVGTSYRGHDVLDVVAPKEKADGDEDDDVWELPF
jgi:hypothetical protein